MEHAAPLPDVLDSHAGHKKRKASPGLTLPTLRSRPRRTRPRQPPAPQVGNGRLVKRRVLRGYFHVAEVELGEVGVAAVLFEAHRALERLVEYERVAA